MTEQETISALISHFQFDRIPLEGTLYKRSYTSNQKLEDGTPVGTAIIGMYCTEPLSASTFHRVSRDETWHFYRGDPFCLYLLFPDRSHKTITMGPDPLQGHMLQFTVPARIWQAGELIKGGHYALFGCTVTPGFTGDCFEAGNREQLIREFPEHKELISKLTPAGGPTRMPEGYNG